MKDVKKDNEGTVSKNDSGEWSEIKTLLYGLNGEDATAPEITRRVRLPVELGAVACGSYLAGRAYDVPAAEAERLVMNKHFEYVADGDITTGE